MYYVHKLLNLNSVKTYLCPNILCAPPFSNFEHIFLLLHSTRALFHGIYFFKYFIFTSKFKRSILNFFSLHQRLSVPHLLYPETFSCRIFTPGKILPGKFPLRKPAFQHNSIRKFLPDKLFPNDYPSNCKIRVDMTLKENNISVTEQKSLLY